MKKMSFTTVGGSSILTIFAILMLVVFALLSLSTAKADRNLTDKTLEANENYYRADARAQEILSQIRGGQVPEGVVKSGETYTYSCPVDAKQELQVEVWVKDGDYKIKKWKKVYTGQWEGDDSIQVFGGVEIQDY
ncbi:MAG: hypothetical protein K6G62_00430 [Eubacterium sp.]|nr:hypothetical protein [Eubacterium sp.]